MMNKEYTWDKSIMVYYDKELSKREEKEFVLETLTANVNGFERKDKKNYIIDIWKKYYRLGEIGYPPGWKYIFRFRDKRTENK